MDSRDCKRDSSKSISWRGRNSLKSDTFAGAEENDADAAVTSIDAINQFVQGSL